MPLEPQLDPLQILKQTLVSRSSRETADALLDDQRERFANGDPIRAEQYLKTFESIASDDSLALDLIYNEFLLLQKPPSSTTRHSVINKLLATDDLSTEEDSLTRHQPFLDRFPEHRERLQRQLEVFSTLQPLSDEDDFDHSILLDHDEFQRCLDDSSLQLHEVIGEGTFAVVFRAYDRTLKRDVAVKFAKRRFDGPSVEKKRFLREAESAAKLTHPGIVTVFEYGESNNRAFLVQEYFSGGTLKDRIQQSEYSIQQAVQWVSGIADAIDYAHHYHIVHRDIKPANILFNDRDQPKVGDFGLVALADHESQLTSNGELIGTPAYMSPEQAMGQTVSFSSDVYSIGVVLFELLNGTPPFLGRPSSVIQQAVNREPDFVFTGRHVPIDLQLICRKALSKVPADRYESAKSLSADLQRFLNNEPIKAKRVGPWEATIRWFARQPALAATICLAVLILFLIGSYSIVKIRNERQRFQTQRDVANQRLFQSLLDSADTNIRSKPDGWHEATLRDLNKAAEMDEAASNTQPLNELLVEALSDSTVRLEIEQQWSGRDKSISATACSSTGAAAGVYAGYGDGELICLSPELDEVKFLLESSPDPILRIDVFSSGQVIAIVGDTLWLWDIPNETAVEQKTIQGRRLMKCSQYCRIAESGPQADHLAIVNLDNEIEIVDLSTNQTTARPEFDIQAAPKHLASSLDGQWLAVGFDNHILQVLNLETGKLESSHYCDDPIVAMAVQRGTANVMWTTRVAYRIESIRSGAYQTPASFDAAPLEITLAPGKTSNPYVLIGLDDGSVVVSDWQHNIVTDRKITEAVTSISADSGDANRFVVADDLGNLMRLRLVKNDFAEAYHTTHAFDIDSKNRLFLDGYRRPAYQDSKTTSSVLRSQFDQLTVADADSNVHLLAGTTLGQLIVKNEISDKPRRIDAHALPIVATGIGFNATWFFSIDKQGEYKFWDAESHKELSKGKLELAHIFDVYTSDDCPCVFIVHDAGVTCLQAPHQAIPEEDRRSKNKLQLLFTDSQNIRHIDQRKNLLVAASEFKLKLHAFAHHDQSELPTAFAKLAPLEISLTFNESICDARLGPNGQKLFVLTDSHLYGWDISGTLDLRNLELTSPKTSESTAAGKIYFAPNNSEYFAITGDGTAFFFGLADCRPFARLQVRVPGIPHAFCFFENGDIAVGDNGLIKLSPNEVNAAFANRMGNSLHQLGFTFEYEIPGMSRAARWCAELSPDEKLIAFGRHFQRVEILDAETMQFKTFLNGFPAEVWTLAFSPDGKWLATGSESSGNALPNHDREGQASSELDPQSNSPSGELQLWSTDTWEPVFKVSISNRLIAGLAFHPEANVLAVSSYDGSLTLVDGRDGQTLQQLMPSQPPARQNTLGAMSVEFSPDGSFLAVARKAAGARVWRLAYDPNTPLQQQQLVDAESFISLKPDGQRIWDLTFDRTGRRLATASEAGQVDVYSVDGFEHLLSMRSGSRRLRKLKFSHDNRLLIGSSWASNGIIWRLDKLQNALNLVTGNASAKGTPDESHQIYLPIESKQNKVEANR